jgi:hypothetical protein
MIWFVIDSEFTMCEKALIEHDSKHRSIRGRVVYLVTHQRRSGASERQKWPELVASVIVSWPDRYLSHRGFRPDKEGVNGIG